MSVGQTVKSEMEMDLDVGKLLDESGAVMRGHFVLSSGRHSDVYFEKFRILEQPSVLSRLCEKIAGHYRTSAFDFVAGPTTGGIIIAFEVARQMGLPSVYIESEEGIKTLRRNRTLPQGSVCLVVDDVLTAGTSLKESKAALELAGSTVGAFAVLIDRSQDEVQLELPLFATYRVKAESYAADSVPEWLARIPVQRPGTRK